MGIWDPVHDEAEVFEPGEVAVDYGFGGHEENCDHHHYDDGEEEEGLEEEHGEVDEVAFAEVLHAEEEFVGVVFVLLGDYGG